MNSTRRDPPSLSPEEMAKAAYAANLTGEPLFMACLPLIRRLATGIAIHHGLPSKDVDDFVSIVLLHIIKDDYAVLVRFRGRSSVRTYLTVVIHRCLQDYRTSQWGKWRASAASRRRGPEAVALERLVVRDGMSLDQACRVLEEGGVPVDRGGLADLDAQFRKQLRFPRRKHTDEAEANRLPSSDRAADDDIIHAEIAAHAASELAAAVSEAAPDDRQMLRLHFLEGLSFTDIARRLHVDRRIVYRQWEHLLGALRTRLSARGVRRHDVLAVLGHAARSAALRPSAIGVRERP